MRSGSAAGTWPWGSGCPGEARGRAEEWGQAGARGRGVGPGRGAGSGSWECGAGAGGGAARPWRRPRSGRPHVAARCLVAGRSDRVLRASVAAGNLLLEEITSTPAENSSLKEEEKEAKRPNFANTSAGLGRRRWGRGRCCGRGAGSTAVRDCRAARGGGGRKPQNASSGRPFPPVCFGV